MTDDWNRAPGLGRYAHVEREHRFRLPALPAGLADTVLIEDTYVVGTRLRLRRVSRDGVTVACKLTQKVRPDPADPTLAMVTNIYLAEAEHALLATVLSGPSLSKRRSRWGRYPGYVVDEFLGRHAGLVLVEVELDQADGAGPATPDGAADVTGDERFTGGAIAAVTAVPPP